MSTASNGLREFAASYVRGLRIGTKSPLDIVEAAGGMRPIAAALFVGYIVDELKANYHDVSELLDDLAYALNTSNLPSVAAPAKLSDTEEMVIEEIKRAVARGEDVHGAITFQMSRVGLTPEQWRNVTHAVL